jgi:acetoin utilization protein AcuB
MLVRNRMSSPVVSVRPDTSFQQALALMQERRIRRLPVVDADHRLVGIVAQRDLLIAALRYLQSRVDVSEVMATRVITANPDMSLSRVAQLMLHNKIGGLPVVEEDKVIGMITESDIFRCFVELHTAAEDDASRAVAPKSEWGRQQRAPGLRTVE